MEIRCEVIRVVTVTFDQCILAGEKKKVIISSNIKSTEKSNKNSTEPKL